MAKMKPVLFNYDMTRAVREDRKTATRRSIKLKYGNTHLEMRTDKYGTYLIEIQNEEPGVTTVRNPDGTTTHRLLAYIEKVPPYRPGDILYVRENWAVTSELPGIADEGPVYMADYNKRELAELKKKHFRWQPSIHMPKELARTFLRVTSVRAERLRKMEIADFVKEGISPTPLKEDGCKCIAYTEDCYDHPCPNRDAYEYLLYSLPFAELWDSTVKPADRVIYGWSANPWVWVIEFERIEGGGDTR